MIKKLRNRILFVYMISISLVIVVSFTLIYIIAGIHMDSLDNERLRSVPTDVLIKSILAAMQESAVPEEREDLGLFINPERDLPIDYNNAFVVNINYFTGWMYISSALDLKKSDYKKAVEKAIGQNVEMGNIKLRGQHWKFLVTGENEEYIVFLNVSDTASARARLLGGMAIMGMFVLGVIFVLCLYFANRAVRPVSESFERQKRFIADASHELKTPLAIIDASSEAMMSDEEATVKSQEKWVGRIGEESTRMRKLIESLLYLAKSEDSSYNILPVNLTHIINDEIGRVEAILFERNIELVLSFYQSEDLMVKADIEKIGESILILLDNAVKYTEEGGKVMVDAGIHKHFGYVKISNTGEGIPPEELPKVFDRFYRVDQARNSSSGSYGLGLSIAKVIVERSDGKIYVTSENGLTSFTIELPLAKVN